ncbi:hypothetical protein M3Y99_00033500 [Aphelenchoides fujianensis]|nr:hypothetical protein M3Y99_00033500 [Aphelenchoides fujianensis]
MALVSRWNDDWLRRDPFWNDRWNDRFSRDWEDWPLDWPRPPRGREPARRRSRPDGPQSALFSRPLSPRVHFDDEAGIRRERKVMPSEDERHVALAPPPPSRLGNDLYLQFSSHLDRFDRNWRDDDFWRDLYPGSWAEPIFKDGLDVRTNITNDRNRFAVEIDAYQFRPEELEVKTLDDCLLIEGRHEDVRDRDNYTKMYFVRKYQLPSDVHPQDITSSIDSAGRLTVEARKPYAALEGRERVIPIEENKVVHFLKTPCRFVSEKLDERKRKKEAARIASYPRTQIPRPVYEQPPPPLPYREPKPDYDDQTTATYTPLDWGHSPPADRDRDRYFRSESRGANGGYRDDFYRRTEPLPPAPVTTTIPVQQTRESYSRSASRSSRREWHDSPGGGYWTETRSASRGPGDFRSESRLGGGGGDFDRERERRTDENLLRPAPEFNEHERSASRASSRSVRMERREQRYS